MTSQQKKYIEYIILRKRDIILDEVCKDVKNANVKLICKTFYRRLFEDLFNYYHVKFLDEIKNQDYISILEYIDYFLYEYENGNMYGWKSLYDNKRIFNKNLYVFPFAQ